MADARQDIEVRRERMEDFHLRTDKETRDEFGPIYDEQFHTRRLEIWGTQFPAEPPEAFSPLALPGLYGWYRPEDLPTGDDDDPVSGWPDAGPEGNDLVPRTIGNLPLLVNDALNGFRGIYCQGAGEDAGSVLETPDEPLLSVAAGVGFSVWMVTTPKVHILSFAELVAGKDITSNTLAIDTNGTNKWRLQQGSGSGAISTFTGAVDTPVIAHARFRLQTVDGLSLMSINNETPVTENCPARAANGLILTGKSTEPMLCSEFVIQLGYTTDEDAALMYEYLSTKYDL